MITEIKQQGRGECTRYLSRELDKLEKLRDEALTASNMDQAQEDAMLDVLLSSKAYCQTNMTLRRARVFNPEERIADELSKQILSEMEKQIQEREDVEPREKDKAISIVRQVFEDTEKALDLAVSAGVLAS